MAMIRNLKGWRTWIVNGLFAILPFIEVVVQVANLTEFKNIVPPQYLPYYALAVVLANMWMRKITSTPLGKSQ